jgi:2-polyprenyl-3-methyl-5-hydroxy-6-metoxy-1,4-benzoquinol methylase
MQRETSVFSPGAFENYGNLVSALSNYNTKERFDLISLLPKHEFESVIEFGCGNGTNLSFFAKELNTKIAVGVDVCNSQKSDRKNFSFHHKTIEDFLDSNQQVFDVIILSDVLEHLYNPWTALLNLKKILSKNGFLLISVPNIENITFTDKFLSGNFFYEEMGLMDQTHIRFFSKKTLSKYLEMSGFKIYASGYRPDSSLAKLRSEVLSGLDKHDLISLNLENASLKVSASTIENKFGQQVLVAACHA